MNIIEAYIKYFNQLIILIIGLPSSNKSEIAKELFGDIKPTFTLININDYMKGFIEKEVNGIKYKLYDYPDNIDWEKLINDIENKKNTGVILYGNYMDNNKINDKIKIDFSYFFDLKYNLLKKNFIEKKMLNFEILSNKTLSDNSNDSEVSKTNSDNADINSEKLNNKLEIYIKDILFPVYKDIKENIKFNKFYNIKEETKFEDIYDDLFDNLMNLIQVKLKSI